MRLIIENQTEHESYIILKALWWAIGVDLSDEESIADMTIKEIIKKYSDKPTEQIGRVTIKGNPAWMSKLKVIKNPDYREMIYTIDEVIENILL